MPPSLTSLHSATGTRDGMGALANAWSCHTPLMTQKAFSLTAAVGTDNEVKITKLDASRVYSTRTAVRVQEIANHWRRDERHNAAVAIFNPRDPGRTPLVSGSSVPNRE